MKRRAAVILVMGPSGAGKSTIARGLAQRLGLNYIEADDFHPAENKALMARGIPLTDGHRWGWLDALAEEAVRHDGPSVLACSALRRTYRDRLRGHLSPMPIIHLAADAGLLLQRVADRADHYMPPSLVQSQLDTLEPPAPPELVLTLQAFDQPEEIITQAAAFAAEHIDLGKGYTVKAAS